MITLRNKGIFGFLALFLVVFLNYILCSCSDSNEKLIHSKASPELVNQETMLIETIFTEKNFDPIQMSKYNSIDDLNSDYPLRYYKKFPKCECGGESCWLNEKYAYYTLYTSNYNDKSDVGYQLVIFDSKLKLSLVVQLSDKTDYGKAKLKEFKIEKDTMEDILNFDSDVAVLYPFAETSYITTFHHLQNDIGCITTSLPEIRSAGELLLIKHRVFFTL